MNIQREKLKNGAYMGDAVSQTALGICHYNAYDFDQNDDQAARWFALSAERGSAAGQFYLGNCYMYGRGVAKNYEEAVRYYKLAAKQGDAKGICNLGYCYHNGLGVEQSDTEAAQWYYLAAILGNPYAQQNYGHCLENGIGVEKNMAKAIEWYQRAAKQGYANAQYILACYYYNGTGVTKSMEDAFNWAYCAAVSGKLDAMRLVGICFDNGYGVVKSAAEAEKWYKKGVKEGHAGSLYNLSDMYYRGKRYTEAEGLARQAYQKDFYSAAKLIACCCEYGKKDLVEALKWYKKSQEHGINAKAEIERIEKILYPPVPKPAFTSGQYSSYGSYPTGTFSGLDYDSRISFVNRCLKDDLALCSNEEQRRLVMERYRTNYPDTPLEDSSYSYDSYSYSDSSLDDKDYLDLLNDIM